MMNSFFLITQVACASNQYMCTDEFEMLFLLLSSLHLSSFNFSENKYKQDLITFLDLIHLYISWRVKIGGCWDLKNLRVHLNWVRDYPKLPGDNGEVPKPNGVVSGSISGRESSLYLTKSSMVIKCLICSPKSKMNFNCAGEDDPSSMCH